MALSNNNEQMSAADDGRYRRGLAQLAAVSGPHGTTVVESLADIAPDLGRYIVEFAYGDVFARPGLDLKMRELATVAALTAMGTAAPQLKVHMQAALRVGASRQEIIETVIQMIPYAGFPAALNAVAIAREVFPAAEQAEGVVNPWRGRGQPLPLGGAHASRASAPRRSGGSPSPARDLPGCPP